VAIGTLVAGSGISLASNEITFTNAGTYSVTFSAQLANANSQVQYAYIWISENTGSGWVDVADSNSVAAVVSKQGSVDGHAIVTVPFTQTMIAGHKIRLIWMTTDAQLTIETIPASGSPAFPRVPGILVSIQQVMYGQVGPTGPTGPTGTTNISSGTAAPSGGVDGDIYLQYV
jgi:hypothetical protein